MDDAPLFAPVDEFSQARVRLADVDGSGCTDIVYLADDAAIVYANESGNGWSAGRRIETFPRVDDLASVAVTDLLGSGTACLVWSSPLPADASRPLRFVDLMGQKPHLLTTVKNNLGAETHITYAPSTSFYLADKEGGRPWITRLPFPVHVVEQVETLDRISGNRFVTRYAYHHGYFDGEEREFRGFAMVEQFDAEGFAPSDDPWFVPSVMTRTWFHTGQFAGRGHVSDLLAREYYRPPGVTDPQALLLPDTVLPPGLTSDEEREACRALKGSMLREEVYALDGTDKEPHPYTVTEQNFTIERVQPRADEPARGVLHPSAREARLPVSARARRSPDPARPHTRSRSVRQRAPVPRDRLRPPELGVTDAVGPGPPDDHAHHLHGERVHECGRRTGCSPHAASVRDANLRVDRLQSGAERCAVQLRGMGGWRALRWWTTPLRRASD